MDLEEPIPQQFESVERLEDWMTRPSRQLVDSLKEVAGDVLVLGAGGKMGPTLSGLAKRALEHISPDLKVFGASRFTDESSRGSLERLGVEPVVCDLLNRKDLESLPECPNVVFMAGMKFGTSGNQSKTWVLNSLVPGLVAERFRNSRIVVFSSGNVYPFLPVDSGGATEQTEPEPIGEYAQSVLARERVFEYFSREYGTPVSIIRLNYAIDLRYGVLLDIAQRVWNNEPVDLNMGFVNVIWQGDANRQALQSFVRCTSPPEVFNVTGPEILSVRQVALRFGELFDKPVRFQGSETPSALLSCSAKANKVFGPPLVSVETMIRWTTDWVKRNGPTFNKPTHFETRNGKF